MDKWWDIIGMIRAMDKRLNKWRGLNFFQYVYMIYIYIYIYLYRHTKINLSYKHD